MPGDTTQTHAAMILPGAAVCCQLHYHSLTNNTAVPRVTPLAVDLMLVVVLQEYCPEAGSNSTPARMLCCQAHASRIVLAALLFHQPHYRSLTNNTAMPGATTQTHAARILPGAVVFSSTSHQSLTTNTAVPRGTTQTHTARILPVAASSSSASLSQLDKQHRNEWGYRPNTCGDEPSS